jgi:hypothetical protein
MEVFSDTFIPSELTAVLGRRCPRCVWPILRPVGSADQQHLLCSSCGHCWRLSNGQLRPVNVLGCQGCAARAKRDCIAQMQDEFPRFGAGRASSVP